jgi:acylphosphatase
MATKALRVRVSGRVQGVGFRQATAEEAHRLGVSGWVRNLPDGRVEAWLEGEGPRVDALASWLRKGPSSAAVTEVEVDDEAAEGHRAFSIRR